MEIESSEEILTFFQNLLKSTDTIIIIADADVHIKYWNEKAEQFFNIKESSVRGRKLSDIAIPQFIKPVMEAVKEAVEKRWQVFLPDLYIRQENDTGRYIGLNIVPIYLQSGTHAGFLIDGKDITETREMKRQNEESQKFRAIGEMAAGIIHEINTPVQFIKNNLQYLNACTDEVRSWLNTPGSEGKREILSTVEDFPEVLHQSLEGIDRITSIIRSLRNYAHPGYDKPVPFSPSQALEDAVTLSENQWKHIARLHTLLPEKPIMVQGFPSLFSQAMVNIIINATHAIEERFGDDALSKGIIEIELEEVGSRAVIRISDNGTGMTEEVKSRVFEPFFTTKPQGKGTGQGLAIVYTAITGKHRGSIHVDSLSGEGTTFTIEVPKG
ncbi:PAS domain-containing sensor histidine kinase [Sediminispirochaeta smaragdinae]|uniref:histidine kinase n=1 Tax=Sediminispirochaeta smaragdinae (strain DSM 11293 / JCM 15392 / SEBR 4228) TaxID=573413 RepID=E1R5X5_SEDSS|nr:ATP-binding protein [Sediminispirochaeta smaragdinae]ADK80740.1 PAS/PAC sensor signal transduction histidine kinase [Sediminispirochaeta smaragdinae DSM 11293]